MTAIVDAATGEVVELDQAAAKKRAGFIRCSIDNTWQLIVEAYAARDWLALGYSSWDAYCTAEFRGKRLAVPREERGAVVGSLRDAGMSLRAISAATDLPKSTVHDELSGVRDRTPELSNVVGIDGKKYTPPKPRPSAVLDDHEASIRATNMIFGQIIPQLYGVVHDPQRFLSTYSPADNPNAKSAHMLFTPEALHGMADQLHKLAALMEET